MKDLIAIIAIVCLLSIFESNQHINHQKSMGTIRIHITNLRNDQGKVKVTLFGTSDGFPDDASKAFRTAIGRINTQEATIIIENIPVGEYAIALLHDENNNDQLDTNLIGIPKEGYGVSNNVKAVLRAPKYEDAKFKLDSDILDMAITVRYF